MITTPAFKPLFHVEASGDEAVFLFTESGHSILQGKAYALLAPLIDGHTTVDELIDLLQDQLPLTDLYFALMTMGNKGYLVESDTTVPSHIAAFWHALNIDPHTALQSLQTTPVSITTFGQVDASLLTNKLQSLSIRVEEEGDFQIVLTDDYLRDDLRLFNEQALVKKRPWVLARPVGSTIWLGPVFRPEETGCWECLAQRLRTHRNSEIYLQQQKSAPEPIIVSRAMLPSTLETSLDLLATEVAKAIVLRERHSLNGNRVSLDLLALKTEQHTLIHRPQCPTCGDAEYFAHHSAPVVSDISTQTPDRLRR